ncbi:DUF262 domain-containing protein [Janthinobacterium rivuli]|uniref:DUF262 domain-containing protein n=1 Tax=Janthinobacterium sp. FT68W TaxID=2654255 RepID=UPI00126425B1|nr:DUF262 domain-containing protein [Janthinobacterium sp. FT68W]KAB8052208.1 DUF262 domain-containing protein [Janthinobacterium sp. FT68W]
MLNSEEKTLNLYPIDYPFETLVARINSTPSKLILDPDFQRKYKWDKIGWERASKFIESCLMRIPLPSCYFAEDESGRHLVIDGVQRLTTIMKFLNDEFALEGMTTFRDLEGKKFSEIGKYAAELEATTIRCIVLRKENPKNLITEIFSRLNQGAVQLSPQEVRHALFPGSFDKLLDELAENPLIANFGMAEDSSRRKDSRESQEQVLRFFAFYHGMEKYEGNLKNFLDDYMQENKELAKRQISKMRHLFNSALEKCISVFGEDDVFTDTNKSRSKQGLVYYDLLMPTVGTLSDEIIEEKSEEIAAAFKSICRSEPFKRTVSQGLQKQSSIVRRRKLWDDSLQEVING